MRILNFFVFIFFTVTASAAGVSVLTTSEREIILQGSSCEQLQKTEKDILAWTKKVEGRVGSFTSCTCKETICSLNVTNSVPLFAREWHGIPSKTLSGNCWNTMFRVNEILPFTRMSYPEDDVRFLLNSPIICKERSVSEPSQSGDMILIRDRNPKLDENQRELHGFIYINDDLSFQKKGFGAGEPIEIVESRYAFTNITNPMCKKIEGNPPKDPEILKACPYYANVYTCSSIKEVLKAKGNQLSDSTKKNLAQIDNVECRLQNINNSPISKASASLSSVKDSLEVIKKWAEDNSANSKNEADEFFINYILHRTQASLSHVDGARTTIFSAENEFPLKKDEQLDRAVEEKEQQIAKWYSSSKKEIDVDYLLLDFTNKYKRLPSKTSESIEEKQLLSKLVEFHILEKIQSMPERFEIYLHPDVYRTLIENNKP